MDVAIVAVVGTLLGTLLGVLGSYLTQSVHYRRESDERHRVLRRQVYLDFLRHVHAVFSEVRAANRTHRRGESTPQAYVEQLRQVPSESAQVALEHLRLTSSEQVAANAARLWAHMRREQVPQGSDRSGEGYRKWLYEYWQLRRAFLDAARSDLDLRPFDWTNAGVNAGGFPSDASDRG